MRTITHPRLILLAASAALTAGMLLPGAASAATVQVSITDNSYSPNSVSASPGDTITWTNNGSMSHTVTADNSSFDSGTLAARQTYSVTVPQTASSSVPYYCRFHGGPGGVGMSGTITVAANSATTSDNTTTAQNATSTEIASSTTTSTSDNTATTASSSTESTSTQSATSTQTYVNPNVNYYNNNYSQNQNSSSSNSSSTNNQIYNSSNFSQISSTTSVNSDLDRELRRLWQDHITWLRLAIIDIANNAPSASSTQDRLMQNAIDMTDVLIRPYYGDTAAQTFFTLFSQHILIGGTIIQAAKAGDTATVDSAHNQWLANANEIAAFLSSLNPQWSEAELASMMHDHLYIENGEAVSYLSGGFDQSIAAYNQSLDQALMMADMLAQGIEY